MRFAFLTSAFIAVASLATACGEDAPADREYKIGMVSWAAYAPLNVAQHKGFWEELGIKARAVNFKVNSELNAALENRDIDFALDMMGSWTHMILVDKVPLILLGETDWSHGGDKIIVKTDYLDRMAELQGGELGVYLKMLSVEFFLDKYLRENDLHFSDFTVIEGNGPKDLADDFIAGNYKLMVNYDPEAARACDEGGGTVVKTSADYPGVIPEGFAARSDYLRHVPESVAVKIFKGFFKAHEWMNDPANFAELAEIMNDWTYEHDPCCYTDEEITSFLGSVSIHDVDTLFQRNQLGGGFSQYLTEASQFMEREYRTDPVVIEDVFDNRAIMKAIAEY